MTGFCRSGCDGLYPRVTILGPIDRWSTRSVSIVEPVEALISVAVFEAALDEVRSGGSESSGNFLEIGCFDPEALPSTATSQRLLVLADKVDSRLGPDTGVGIEIRLTDWIPISETVCSVNDPGSLDRLPSYRSWSDRTLMT